MYLFVLYLIFALIFTVLDLFWLGWLMKDFYAAELGDLARKTPEWISAALAYLLLTIAPFFYIFSVIPPSESIATFAFHGAILGLVIYGIYELTNYAMIKDWPIKVVIIDIAWGVILYTLTVTSVAAIQKVF